MRYMSFVEIARTAVVPEEDARSFCSVKVQQCQERSATTETLHTGDTRVTAIAVPLIMV